MQVMMEPAIPAPAPLSSGPSQPPPLTQPPLSTVPRPTNLPSPPPQPPTPMAEQEASYQHLPLETWEALAWVLSRKTAHMEKQSAVLANTPPDLPLATWMPWVSGALR